MTDRLGKVVAILGGQLGLLASAQAQSLRFVDAGAPAGGNGRSWATAYVDLQDALADASVPQNQINAIWVAAGSYRPDRGTGNRNATFQLRNGLTLLGGFPPGGGTPNDRNPAAARHHPKRRSGGQRRRGDGAKGLALRAHSR